MAEGDLGAKDAIIWRRIMKKVFGAVNMIEASFVKNSLESLDIPSFIKNEAIADFVGHTLPFGTSAEPTIWVDDEDFDAASKCISDLFKDKSVKSIAPNWKCPHCSEQIKGQFDTCWQCLTPMAKKT